jgi:hypothetical protein
MDFIENNIVLFTVGAVYALVLVIFIVCILLFPDEMIQEWDEDWNDKF